MQRQDDRTRPTRDATRLATQHDARVSVLTLHHALRGDIRHVFESVPEAQGLLGEKIHVETATSFLLAVVAAAGGTVPLTADGSIDYDRTDATFREVADSLRPHAPAPDGATVVEEDRSRFDWDHVLVDEAQDWTDADRDLLVAVYGSRRMVLADGLVFRADAGSRRVLGRLYRRRCPDGNARTHSCRANRELRYPR